MLRDTHLIVDVRRRDLLPSSCHSLHINKQIILAYGFIMIMSILLYICLETQRFMHVPSMLKLTIVLFGNYNNGAFAAYVMFLHVTNSRIILLLQEKFGRSIHLDYKYSNKTYLQNTPKFLFSQNKSTKSRCSSDLFFTLSVTSHFFPI